MAGNPQIGTLREKPLHAALKRWYARPGDQLEVAVDGYVIDLVRDGLLVEIQTRGFSSMKRKAIALLETGHRIRLVYPVAVDRWIVKIGADGDVLSRRRSPRHGQVVDVFAELVSFPEYLASHELEVEVILISEEEYRHHVPGRAWRRDGWVTLERHLIEVIDSHLLCGPRDLAGLLPEDLPEVFDTYDLARCLGITRRAAQQTAYCLRKTDVVVAAGKRGRGIIYERRR